MNKSEHGIDAAEIEAFWRDGYLVVPNWYRGAALKAIQQSARDAAAKPSKPWELEAALGYPGAPAQYGAGSATPRRLLGAYGRNGLWQWHASGPRMLSYLRRLFADDTLYLSQAHHNCLMTKTPRFSSDTGWHQDIRYWHYPQKHLINAWLALGDETPHNGGLTVIPGSHGFNLLREQFDQQLFLKLDHHSNQALLKKEHAIELKAGDVLFFHCCLLHRARRNLTAKTKLSLVFTYSAGTNLPIEGTRSASAAVVPLFK